MAEAENPFAKFTAPPDTAAPAAPEGPNPFAQFVPGADTETPAGGPGFKSKVIGSTEFGMPIFEDPAENQKMLEAHNKGTMATLLGIAKGIHDVPRSVLQMWAHGGEWLMPEGSKAKEYMTEQRRALDTDTSAIEKGYNEAVPEEAKTAASLGRLGGNVAATAPLAAVIPGANAAGFIPRVAAQTIGGAVTAPLTTPVDVKPGTDFWGEKGKQAEYGAAGGAVAPFVTAPLARMISPNVRPEVRTMMEAGVRPTPGQIAGGMGNRLEEAATSVPIVGDFIGNARRRAVEDFNRGAVNQALEPMGATLARDVPVGREAIGALHQAIGDAYNQITPHLNVTIDRQLARDLAPVGQMRAAMSDPSQQQFDRIMDNEVWRRFDAHGRATGQQYRDMESELGRQTADYIHSPAPSDREVGRALQQVQLRLRDLLERSNPAHADELRAIHNAFAQGLRVEGAAAKTGAEGGVFTPAQFGQSVRQLDPTLRKNAYARGDALMQEYADAGRAVLGDRLPNSGTPYRGMAAALAGLGALSLHSPWLAGGIAAGGGGIGATYSRPGVSALAHLMATRWPGAAQEAAAIRGPGPSTLAGILASQGASVPATVP